MKQPFNPSVSCAMDMPKQKPHRPYFSSGPCAKRPGWSASALGTDTLGRSHRAAVGKARLQEALDKTRDILAVPSDYLLGIVPASDTGAVEMAMWNLLGVRDVTLLAWESFGQGWVTDAVKQLKIDPTVLTAPYGELPDLLEVHPSHDVVFTWNGTTSGVRVPNGDWISDAREGLTICDATSSAFAQDLPWQKLDVTTYSWQKVLGGEAQHGMLILSPRAVERLESYTPPWPLPKIFRLTKGGKLIDGIFKGATINTPSMLCVEDYIDALNWAIGLGGLDGLKARADENLSVLEKWVANTPWVDFLAQDKKTRSNTSVCLSIVDNRFQALSEEAQRNFTKQMEKRLSDADVGHDFNGYRDAPPGLRIWCGATVEASDLQHLTPWLDWVFHTEISTL
ncbi:MAG: phosphoserine transaminase [Pseudomonadota bacterium]